MRYIDLEDIAEDEEGRYDVDDRYREAGAERPSLLDLELFALVERDLHRPLPFQDTLEQLQSLVARGARVDAKKAYIGRWIKGSGDGDDPFFGEARLFTPLEYAAFNDQPKWVRAFAEAGLPVKDKAVARLAVSEQNLAFVWALHDADALELGVSGETTLLHLALNSPELVATLVSWGADINAVDEKGRSALHHGDLEVLASIEYLLRAGADPNLVATDGQTAFAALAEKCLKRYTRYFNDQLDSVVLAFLVAGVDLETPVLGEETSCSDSASIRGGGSRFSTPPRRTQLMSAREWILESSHLHRAKKIMKEGGDVRLAAARELLKGSLVEPKRPPAPRPELPAETVKGAVMRESGVPDRIVFVSGEPERYGKRFGVPIDQREHLPRAREIDRAVFELIERDATAEMSPGVALSALQHLASLGARVDCVQGAEVCDEFGDPEDGPLDYDKLEKHFAYFTPLELAAALNVPRWVGIFKAAGLPVADENAAVSAAVRDNLAFLKAMHAAGALSEAACTTALSAAVRGKAPLKMVEQLLDWGADVNAAGALRYVGGSVKLEVIRTLLAAGADPNAPDTKGLTPFARYVDRAQLFPDDSDDGVALYLAHGADPEAVLPPEEDLGFGDFRAVATTARAIIEGRPMPRAQAMLRVVDARRIAQEVLVDIDAQQAEQLAPRR